MRYKMKTEEKYNFLDSQVGQLYEEGQKKPRSGIHDYRKTIWL